MKLEIESDNSHVLGLAAKTFEILSLCKGYHTPKDAITASMDTARILI